MMKSLRYLGCFALVFGLLASLGAQTDKTSPHRIAVIDVQKVLAESSAGKAAFEKLKKLQEGYLAQARAKEDEINTLAKASPSDPKLAEKRAELQRFMKRADEEVSANRDRELAGLEQLIKPAVDAVAAELKLDAIFNKYESGLVFASDRLDITDAVISRFNTVATKK